MNTNSWAWLEGLICHCRRLLLHRVWAVIEADLDDVIINEHLGLYAIIVDHVLIYVNY